MGLTSQPFQHLINERKGVMIFPSGLVETSVVNADSPAILHSGWNELILLVGHDSHSGFLWNYLHRADPLAVRDGIDNASLQ